MEITKGTKIYMSEKNKILDFKPGSIEQEHFEGELYFDCGLLRSISYFLEPIIFLGIYSKNYLELKLKGITNDNIDIHIDNFKNALIPFISKIYSK